MTTAYIVRSGATVRARAGALLVIEETPAERDDDEPPSRRQKIATLEPHRLEALILVGRATISANALRLCTAERISVALFDGGGNLLARVTPPLARSADLRLHQYRLHHDPAERAVRARAVVTAKLANAAAVLRGLARSQGPDPFQPVIPRLDRIALDAALADTPEALLGVEGLGARTYFEGLGHGFVADLSFLGRAQRPPPDPVNALLSFGYVLLGNRIAGLLEARGADPSLGFLHELRPGRPSLALDLLEELRHPIVDRLVLRLANLRRLRADQFEPDAERPGGVRLTEPGRRIFLDEWERHLAHPVREAGVGPAERLDVHRLLLRQIERFVADLRGGEPYRPFRFEG